jgi:hypothetical protein
MDPIKNFWKLEKSRKQKSQFSFFQNSIFASFAFIVLTTGMPVKILEHWIFRGSAIDVSIKNKRCLDITIVFHCSNNV